MSSTGPHDDQTKGMSGPGWDERREALAEKLRRHQAEQADDGPRNNSRGFQGAAEGLKLASEFVAGVLVGAGLGYLIDRFAGTSPFGLIIFLILGFAAGVMNVLRSIGAPKPPR
ncbi:AtpZ/AtpI family protein [Mangrovicella endophytica]|uniref:AtpZ/AtpI family protein n=1 Tax=Mangrovicella endophytica TaxID=2066697 RepID=UPI001FDEDBE6|nr:AtpZ/AtpI family protein [Mangrovicella endophytica]